MSGELQSIPARHGVATFVPRGRTIKIINTYGKQVVSTWAFGLGAPPGEGGDDDEEERDIERKVEELQEELDKGEAEGTVAGKEAPPEVKEEATKETKEESQPEKGEGSGQEVADDPPEQAPDTPENEKNTDKKPGKRTWSSYLPSIPYRSKNQNQPQGQPGPQTKQEEKAEKAQNEATSKKWSSYLPTGKGFSSYVPNLQMPDTQGVVSAFKSSNSWDPNKSYAEQLYDFSKTPVGAGTLAAASGSGTASSLYAAYNAYTKLNPLSNDQPPMEYLSLPHTRAATNHLVPEINDTLLTNLRNPLMTLIEDTSTGAHDTLTAACDANMYAVLGVSKPEEHGSCAENLVLALKELNEKAGLKGTKAVGADITVNIAPTPLHLFMNAPLQLDTSAQSEGSGAKGATLKVEEPKSKKRSYVRFRAERDIVVVLSACPNKIGPQNGGKCMAANFMVEEPEEDLSASTSSVKGKKGAPKKLDAMKKVPEKEKGEKGEEKKSLSMPSVRGGPQKPAAVQESAQKVAGDDDDPPESSLPEDKKEEGDEEDFTGMPRLRGGPQKIAAMQKAAEERARARDDADGPLDPALPEEEPRRIKVTRLGNDGDPPESALPEEEAKKEEAKPEATPQEDKKQEAAPSQDDQKDDTTPKASTPQPSSSNPPTTPKPKKKPKKLERRGATPKSEAS